MEHAQPAIQSSHSNYPAIRAQIAKAGAVTNAAKELAVSADALLLAYKSKADLEPHMHRLEQDLTAYRVIAQG